MDLVGYSDSESSDIEHSAKPLGPRRENTEQPFSAKNKSAFPKVISQSEPRKIKVALPKVSQSENQEQGDDSAPPVKKAKTSGGFGGFNSLLPAPKNAANKPGSLVGDQSRLQRVKGTGLAPGVSLKTGATPVFIREAEPVHQSTSTIQEDSVGDQRDSWNDNEKLADEMQPPPRREEPELIGKPTMFKPLSVSRKPSKKKKLGTESSIATATMPKHVDSVKSQDDEVKDKQPQPKKKVSLFSAGNEELVESQPGRASTNTDEPFPESSFPNDSPQYEAQREQRFEEMSSGAPQTTSSTNNLSDLANNLGLTAAEKRQLFGRSGQPSDAQIAQFSLAAEYAHNRQQIEDQNSTPMLNPVKSIAPGKHSLQQLVNAATNQKDALEESFAQGRRNKKDAGSKYGF